MHLTERTLAAKLNNVHWTHYCSTEWPTPLRLAPLIIFVIFEPLWSILSLTDHTRNYQTLQCSQWHQQTVPTPTHLSPSSPHYHAFSTSPPIYSPSPSREKMLSHFHPQNPHYYHTILVKWCHLDLLTIQYVRTAGKTKAVTEWIFILRQLWS